MGLNLMEFGIYVREGVMFTMKGCYRTVLHHPFLVCVVSVFIYISRSFPLMFSLLVSASPVVVCTALLLGTLLFYGQQNIHETETEMKTKYEAVSRRLSLDGNVVEQNERYSGESKRDDAETSLLVNKLSEIRVGGSTGSLDGLTKGRRSSGVDSENGENWEENGALGDPLHEEKCESNEGRERETERERLGDGEVMADHYAIISKVIGELLESESDQSDQEKSEGDSNDSERGNSDKRRKGEEDDDSASDRAESSSPDDTSIEDIMPMLDELHPLLDEEGAQPPQLSCAASEAALTEQSPRSSIESADETDAQESEAADDDNDDDEAQDEKEDHTKSVIAWTEEDQKNLMEVGNSEIERNLRLERILRRRKNRSMVPEINLMDFENSDCQFQIPPISTARQNPFDLPHESLPGSAPSVMLQRKNPFDMPYEEEDDPSETESREELKPSLSRQPFLRRRDNFTARPSIFSPSRQERLPVKLRPFFVAEQTVVDESSYSPFKRQSSGNSSVHETESVTSVEYLEDEKLEEGDDPSGDQDQDQVSNDQETADVAASSSQADDVPNRDPVYDTDTSPTAAGKNYSSSSSFADAQAEPDKQAQGDVPSSSSHFSDRLEVEHSVDDGDTVGEEQVPNASSTESTSTEVNALAGATPKHPEQEILDSVEGEK